MSRQLLIKFHIPGTSRSGFKEVLSCIPAIFLVKFISKGAILLSKNFPPFKTCVSYTTQLTQCIEQLYLAAASGQGARFTVQSSRVQNLGGGKVDSAFYSSEVDQMNARRIIGDLVVKSKLSPRNGSAALRQLKPIHEKGS